MSQLHDMGDAFGPGASLQSSISAAPPIADTEEAHGTPEVHPDQAREELWGLLMPMAIIRELTGTQHQDGYATVEAVRSALHALSRESVIDERAEFEAWYLRTQRARGIGARLTDAEMLVREGDSYRGLVQRDRWEGWQARAALNAQPKE